MPEGPVEIKPPSEAVKKGPFPQYSEGSDFFGVRRILETRRALSARSRIKHYGEPGARRKR